LLLCTVFAFESRTYCQERSPFSPFTSVHDDDANYIHRREKQKKKLVSAAPLIHRRAQVQPPQRA